MRALRAKDICQEWRSGGGGGGGGVKRVYPVDYLYLNNGGHPNFSTMIFEFRIIHDQISLID